MTSIILRRRKLGRGSSRGIANFSTTGIYTVRNWKVRDIPAGVTTDGFVFRWGCTSNVPYAYRNRQIVNTAESIHWCSDKRQGRLDMQEGGVSVPETWCNSDFFDEVRHGVFIVRPVRHSQGRNLHFGTQQVLKGSLLMYSAGYVSRLIHKVAEYRVFVCQNRVAWVAKKTPGNPDDVAWNVARGGRFDNVRWDDWPKDIIIQALKAAKVSGCDFCGVDVMVDADGKAYVLEVNSAPSQTSEYRQSCVAKCFDYIVMNGKQHFEDVVDSPRRTWKSYIHPAVRTNDGQVPSDN